MYTEHFGSHIMYNTVHTVNAVRFVLSADNNDYTFYKYTYTACSSLITCDIYFS